MLSAALLWILFCFFSQNAATEKLMMLRTNQRQAEITCNSLTVTRLLKLPPKRQTDQHAAANSASSESVCVSVTAAAGQKLLEHRGNAIITSIIIPACLTQALCAVKPKPDADAHHGFIQTPSLRDAASSAAVETHTRI